MKAVHAAATLLLTALSNSPVASAMKVTSCRTITSWSEFTEALDSPDESGNVVNFCPFDIAHNGDDTDGYDVTTDYLRVSCDKKTGTAGDAIEQVVDKPWLNNNRVAYTADAISGQDPPKCIIRGTARHLNINSKAFTMIGFDMYGSTSSAIHIAKKAKMTTLTELAFVENEGTTGALSIAAGAQQTTVLHCEFTSNSGNAIHTDVDGADLMVYRSYFHTNVAPDNGNGGAIFANTAFVASRSEFLSNKVTSAAGPAIYDADGTACDGGENIACENSDLATDEECDGIFSGPANVCYEFSSACEFPSASPTVSPTKGPTRSPTVSPVTRPSASPTRGPTKKPTASPTTASPTADPTGAPTTSQSPTSAPTKSPTVPPTVAPSAAPSCAPSLTPSAAPTSPTPSPTVGNNIGAPIQVTPQFPVSTTKSPSYSGSGGKGSSGKGSSSSGKGGSAYQPHVNHDYPTAVGKGSSSSSNNSNGASVGGAMTGGSSTGKGTSTAGKGGSSSTAGKGGSSSGTTGKGGSSGKGSSATATSVGGAGMMPPAVSNDRRLSRSRHNHHRRLEQQHAYQGTTSTAAAAYDDDSYLPAVDVFKHSGTGKGSSGKGSNSGGGGGTGPGVPGQGMDKCSGIAGPNFPTQRKAQRRTKGYGNSARRRASSIARS